MENFVFQLSRHISKETAVLIIAALPVFELRGAIPVAISVFRFSWEKAFLLSFIGNIAIIIPYLIFLEKFAQLLMMKFSFVERFLNWIFARTRKRSKLIEKYEALGLILFVAVPLPITGAWTGCVAAFLFGIKKRIAFLCISLGVLIAGIIVTATTLGIIKIF